MAVEENLIELQDLGEAQSILFASKFESDFSKLLEFMGITRKIPMNIGTALKQYSFDVTDPAPSSDIPEGEIIPLTEVKRKEKIVGELKFRKRRKSTSIESVQGHGIEMAVNATDRTLLKFMQQDILEGFFSGLATATEDTDRSNTDVLSAETLQGAIAHGSANLQEFADSDLSQVIAFVNPKDVANHLANGQINSNGAIFGVNLLEDYIGARIISNKRIPQGEVYLTLADNIVVPYANPSGAMNIFGLETDKTGFIGVVHEPKNNRFTYDTSFISAVTLFVDNIDLVAKVTIGAGATATDGTATDGTTETSPSV